jgi:hypothetical protein
MEMIVDSGIYEVQTRKQNGKYQNRLKTTNLGHANAYYNAINIGNPYTKRFLVNGKTIHKVKGS